MKTKTTNENLVNNSNQPQTEVKNVNIKQLKTNKKKTKKEKLGIFIKQDMGSFIKSFERSKLFEFLEKENIDYYPIISESTSNLTDGLPRIYLYKDGEDLMSISSMIYDTRITQPNGVIKEELIFNHYYVQILTSSDNSFYMDMKQTYRQNFSRMKVKYNWNSSKYKEISEQLKLLYKNWIQDYLILQE